MSLHRTIRKAGHAAQAYADRVREGAESGWSSAQELAEQGRGTLLDASRQVREQVWRASAAGSEVVRQHPVKTLAVGVAAVALTLAVVSMLSRRRSR